MRRPSFPPGWSILSLGGRQSLSSQTPGSSVHPHATSQPVAPLSPPGRCVCQCALPSVQVIGWSGRATFSLKSDAAGRASRLRRCSCWDRSEGTWITPASASNRSATPAADSRLVGRSLSLCRWSTLARSPSHTRPTSLHRPARRVTRRRQVSGSTSRTPVRLEDRLLLLRRGSTCLLEVHQAESGSSGSR